MCNISIHKEYRTKSGKKVRLYTVEAGGLHPIHGAIYSEHNGGFWTITSWDKDGYAFDPSRPDFRDLVEYCQYSEFKQDDPIFYQNCDDDYWRIGHFSHVENRVPYVFKDGRTSFTSTGNSPSKPVYFIKPLDKS